MAADPEALRQALVAELKKKGFITESAIEAAFLAVPRHMFLPGIPVDQAYKDTAVATKQIDQRPVSSASQPAIMAIMLRQLRLEPGHRVLEIGAGTGYNAALMASMVGEEGTITTVEIDQDLAAQARTNLAAAGFDRVKVICSDGGPGCPERAPYDRIIATVGAPDIPPAWHEQLTLGGLLVIPLSLFAEGMSKSIAFEKTADCLVSRSAADCAFLPLRGRYAISPLSVMPIGPEAGLHLCLARDKADAVDAQEVYRLLTGGSRDVPAGIETTALKLATRFWPWMSLKRAAEADCMQCSIVAAGPLADRGIVPHLYGVAGKAVSTTGLIGKAGMALLARPRGSSVPAQPVVEERPFELIVRSFGEEDRLVSYLKEQLAAWTAAGCPPDPDRLKVRAWPKDHGYEPMPNEFVIEKPSVRLLLAFD